MVIRGNGHTPRYSGSGIQFGGSNISGFIMWSEELKLIRVRSFPYMEAHVLKVDALCSVWVTVVLWVFPDFLDF